MCQTDLWNQIEVFISLFEWMCRGLEVGKNVGRDKKKSSNAVMEQRLRFILIFHFNLTKIFAFHI